MSEITNYLSPCSLSDAARAMADGDVTILCGGTDLTLQMDAGQKQYASTLMNIRRIDELSGIKLSGNTCRIGALTTVTDIMNDPVLNDIAPVLAEAADQFASDQIRNAASIGGNICNASPAGDMIIPLLLLDASVELVSWLDGNAETRLVSLEDFFTGPGKTVMRGNELLAAVVFDKPASEFIARFRKTGPRPALEIATVSIGIGGCLAGGVFSGVRVALGAVSPTPIRAPGAEATLEGKPLNADGIKAAIASIAEDIAPIDDIRASAWYRNHLVHVLTEEVLNDVFEKGN